MLIPSIVGIILAMKVTKVSLAYGAFTSISTVLMKAGKYKGVGSGCSGKKKK